MPRRRIGEHTTQKPQNTKNTHKTHNHQKKLENQQIQQKKIDIAFRLVLLASRLLPSLIPCFPSSAVIFHLLALLSCRLLLSSSHFFSGTAACAGVHCCDEGSVLVTVFCFYSVILFYSCLVYLSVFYIS
jgi:hypothetical protein